VYSRVLAALCRAYTLQRGLDVLEAPSESVVPPPTRADPRLAFVQGSAAWRSEAVEPAVLPADSSGFRYFKDDDFARLLGHTDCISPPWWAGTPGTRWPPLRLRRAVTGSVSLGTCPAEQLRLIVRGCEAAPRAEE
jgi:hypothetical protein